MDNHASDAFLLVGLGNPGEKYRFTRHNIGFMVAERLALKHGARFSIQESLHELCEIEMRSRKAIVVKPLTFMNRSGDSVAKLVDRYEISIDRILVISDDFNIPFGKLRLRAKGSDGGHNGLASIIGALDRQDFARLRVGIGRLDIGEPADFVLSEFNSDENRYLDDIIASCAEACEYFLVEGITNSMNRFNNTLID